MNAMMKRLLFYIPIGILALLIGLWWLSAIQLQTPRSLKLANLDEQYTEVSLTLPKGKTFNLVIDFPRPPKIPFKGKCKMQVDGRERTFVFSEKTIYKCNWLHEKSRGWEYILTWNQLEKTYYGKDFLVQQRHCTITIEFEQEIIPKGLSLWLCWLGRLKDSPKNEAERKKEIEDLRLTISSS